MFGRKTFWHTLIELLGQGAGSNPLGGPPDFGHSLSEPRVKKIEFNSIADLAAALNRAKIAHTEFERGLGQPDYTWPLWYASFLAAEQGLEVNRGRGCGAGECKPVKRDRARDEEDFWVRH